MGASGSLLNFSLVVGLGNPGDRYSLTRHNIGFRIVDALYEKFGSGARWTESHGGLASELRIDGERIRLLKPLLFMNRSGESLAPFMRFFKVPLEEVLVIHDEVDLPLGSIRLKKGGGEAGHNGLRSITTHIGTNEYARLRFGVGKGPYETSDWVLEKFSSEEERALPELIATACDAVVESIKSGMTAAQNKFHRDKKENE